MALRQPPQTQPVSKDQMSLRPCQPKVDQWPKATVMSAVRRPGTSNQGMKPVGACAALSLVANSMVPSAAQKRRRVKALTTTRQRSSPVKSSRQAAGSLPYMWAKK